MIDQVIMNFQERREMYNFSLTESKKYDASEGDKFMHYKRIGYHVYSVELNIKI